jgi:hypothetical protein
MALYKGLSPTLVSTTALPTPVRQVTAYSDASHTYTPGLQIGIAPYAALNFASYDLAKQLFYHGEKYVPVCHTVYSKRS